MAVPRESQRTKLQIVPSTYGHNNRGGGTVRLSRLVITALLLDIGIVNPCESSNLENTAHDAGEQPADAVELKKTKYAGSFPATYSLLPLVMLTCDAVGSDVHVLIKELAIRWVEHRSETRSDRSQHLVEVTEVVSLRRRFSFVSQQALSFRMRHHLCRQEVALASTRQLHLQGPASVHAHRTEGLTWPKEQDGANGVGGRIGVGWRERIWERGRGR